MYFLSTQSQNWLSDVTNYILLLNISYERLRAAQEELVELKLAVKQHGRVSSSVENRKPLHETV